MRLEHANDPICGRLVETSSVHATEYKKRRYYFCSTRCRERFEAQTERMRLQELARMGALFANARVVWGMA